MPILKPYKSGNLYGYIIKNTGKLIYIGVSNDINERHHSHLQYSKINAEPINKWLQEHPDDYELITFKITIKSANWQSAFNPSIKLARNLETAFIKTFIPKFNKNQKK